MDYTKVTESVNLMPQQVMAGWSAVQNIETNFSDIKNIVVCGMGGSALGARILDSFTSNIPLKIVNNYNLPDFAEQNSLVIISSYSGNTEEIVSCFEQSVEKNLQTFVIATGGKIGELAEQNNTPFYKIDPKENPSKQPRLASGYSIGAMLSLFSKLNIVKVTKEDLESALNFESPKNKAQEIAEQVRENAVICVASEHLIGSTHAAKNMLNETSKNFSSLFELPELNHHLMEGLKHPINLRLSSKFLFIESDIYHPRIQKRYETTKDVVTQNEYKYLEYKAKGDTKLKQIFEVLALGGYLQIYLGQIYNEDPTSIPWVDYFKKKMAN